MKTYFAVVDKDHSSAYGLWFPDVPGCFSASDREEDIVKNAIEALLEAYLRDGNLHVEKMGRGYAWLDTGTHASLLDASNFVRTLTERQGLQVGSPDEVAYLSKWITKEQISTLSKKFGKNSNLNYLR